MQMFRDLSVFCEPGSLDSLMSQIETSLTHGWSRDRMRESKLSRLYRKPVFCFLRTSDEEIPATVLVMTTQRFGASVCSIVPDGRDLSCDQYNSILTEFYLRFLHPAASQNGLITELSSDELGIEEGLGAKAARLLKAFTDTANKSAMQPGDRSRWFAFLISLHCRPRCSDYSGLLADWLLKEGWSRDETSKLVCEWEFARDLLPAYDDHRFSGSKPSSSDPPTALSPSDLAVKEAFGSTALELLERFSVLANKSITHPLDEGRWFAFLICLHDRHSLDHNADLVKDWLLKNGWSEKKASKLISELEFTRDLLRAYDHHISGDNQTENVVRGALVSCAPEKSPMRWARG
ncbi:MAG: hypothetical protein WCE23_13370 [Candidatus Binatus sp.]|uniref:hypothetical protein n=1 Tax=Candidatus Binatus sp. TaxID=2811406 RepID=UPI003C706279